MSGVPPLDSNAKHTPGPWEVATTEHESQFVDARGKYDYGAQAVLIVAPGDCAAHPIADCSANYTCREQDECEANALLCAAAPDLLASLREMVERFDNDDTMLVDLPFIERARAAIAKATEP